MVERGFWSNLYAINQKKKKTHISTQLKRLTPYVKLQYSVNLVIMSSAICLLIPPSVWSTMTMNKYKENGWPLCQKQCSIRMSRWASSMRQKQILSEICCYRRFHDRGQSSDTFENGWQKAGCGTLHNADMYVYDHTLSCVGEERVFAKMNHSPYNAVLQQNLLTALMIQQAMDLTHHVCFAFVKLISLKCKKNWSRFRPGSHPAWTDYRTSFSKSVLMCWHHLCIISSTFLLNKHLSGAMEDCCCLTDI